ncbi:MAG TPA: sulfite exporter TauE/SafE family protein, partial [Candidatus Goldiibacteriota bacterium]|nr:sulfite exporter TauE/SafE family protein [Candidatus Goldiibacteriota bacterium]
MTSLLVIAVLAVSIIFSMLGLGGGVLYVPILMSAGITFHQAVATSLLIMLVMSLTASVVYHMEKLVDWKLLLLLEPFSVTGAIIGSYNSNIFPEKALLL